MKELKISAILLLALTSQLMVKANNGKKQLADSMVLGSIMDVNSKKPIGDVTVSVSSSSARQQAKKETRSDASGSFILSQMPPGEFTLQLERKGYKTYRKDFVMTKEGGIQLKLSMEEDDEDSFIDSWNPLRILYGR
jgi:hypothetical protein